MKVFVTAVKYFLGLPLVNMDLGIVPACLWWSDTPVLNLRVFIKQVFLLDRRLSVHVGSILLKYIVSDIRVESSWSSINSNYRELESPISEILSWVDQ